MPSVVSIDTSNEFRQFKFGSLGSKWGDNKRKSAWQIFSQVPPPGKLASRTAARIKTMRDRMFIFYPREYGVDEFNLEFRLWKGLFPT